MGPGYLHQHDRAVSAITGGPDPMFIYDAALSLARRPAPGVSGMGGLSRQDAEGDAKTIVVAAALSLAVRSALGAYVGSKLGRPVAGAVVTALFGPLGLGVLSFWKK